MPAPTTFENNAYVKSLLAALEEVSARLSRGSTNGPELSLLDSFVFRTGKPGLFTTWTDLDMTPGIAGGPAHRKDALAALRNLATKGAQTLERLKSQLDPGTLEKYRSMTASIREKTAALGDALSPPNHQPLLSALEEADRRLKSAPDASALDAFTFHPGKPGLFIAWTDLDFTNAAPGSPNNRNAVMMALDDLLAQFDRMIARPACQKTLGAEAVERYLLVKKAVSERLSSIKTPAPAARPSVQPPKLFSKAGWIDAGSSAGFSMAAALVLSAAFHPFARATPLIGLMAAAFSFLSRHRQIISRENAGGSQEAEGCLLDIGRQDVRQENAP